MPAEDPDMPVVRDAWELWNELEKDFKTKSKMVKELEQRKKETEERKKKTADGRSKSVRSSSAERKDKK